MNTKAFNINSYIINEKELYPEDYIIDNTLDKDVLDFFNSQKNAENIFPKKSNTINKPLTNLIEKENNFNNEEEEEEENSSESSELIYSNFPDNISITKNKVYEKMNINANIIQAVIEEFSKLKNKFIKNSNYNINDNNNKSENNKFVFSSKEFNNYDNTPSDDFIRKNILPFKSNEYLMKNINKCLKVLKTFNKSQKKEINKLSQWIYTFLLFLEMPLSPDNCADLYSLNKYIFNNFMKSPELKIIFVIICEIFKQILIL
jgi:hypothetical protein